ncbi:MAG: sulfite exporter TauE/SafE family protein [Clostridiales bacterium]|nr:sulfite exporter TauE/SafE family protein [Clostridiales bacterium]
MIFWEILAGICGGVVGGMGMGGGTLTIPILTIFLSYPQIFAQGINLIAFLPMSVVALCIHIKNKLVDFKSTWLLALVGSLFSLGGAILANHLSNSILRKLFALFLIGLAIWQIICTWKKEN